MGDQNVVESNQRPWYLTRIPTLPGEKLLGEIDTGEGRSGRAAWILYQQFKQEVCTMMRRLHATKDAIQVCDQILAQEPELPLVNYISEWIAQYMASESAWDEEYFASESAVEHATAHDTTNVSANMTLDSH